MLILLVTSLALATPTLDAVEDAPAVHPLSRPVPTELSVEDGEVRWGGSPLTAGEDRFYAAVSSPDRTRVVLVGSRTGLHVLDLRSGHLAHLGPGTRPAWSPDGTWLALLPLLALRRRRQ